CFCHKRFTITRAVIGFCGDAIHCASASRRPDVWPSGRGISVGGLPYVITSMKPGFICEPWLSTSPRIKKYEGGTSYRPGPLCRYGPAPGTGTRHFGQLIVSSPSPSGDDR